MPFAVTQYLQPTTPDSIFNVVEVNGLFVSMQENFGSDTWAVFDPATNTAVRYLKSDNNRQGPAVAWSGYAWSPGTTSLFRLDPTTGATSTSPLANGLSIDANTAVVGSTLYALYGGSPGRLVAIDLVTRTDSLVAPVASTASAREMVYASDGALWVGRSDRIERVTLGGALTTYPLTQGVVSQNMVEYGGYLYYGSTDGLARFDLSAHDAEVFYNGGLSMDGQVRLANDGRWYTSNRRGTVFFGTDVNTGLVQQLGAPFLYWPGASSFERSYLFQRSNGDLWMVSPNPPTYP